MSRQKAAVPLLTAFAMALLLSLAVGAGALSAPEPAPAQPRVIRWIVAHDRGNSFFTQLLDNFAATVAERSGGALKVEFLPSQASDTELDNDAYDQVLAGKADMSQLAAARAGVPVFDQPMVFRNYDHAEAVFESPVAKKLLASVSSGSQGRMEGFAFTYSGGYRILVGNVAINKLSDLKGVKVRRNTPSARFLSSMFGAKPVEVGPESRERPIRGILSGELDLEETEVNRLAIVGQAHPDLVKRLKYINLTHHRMYVTAIVANAEFLSSLTDAQRSMLVEEIHDLSVKERKLSVDLEAGNLRALADTGAHVVELPAAEQVKLAEAAKRYLRKFPDMAAEVKEIQAVRDTRLASQ